jgi:hypothetical protein
VSAQEINFDKTNKFESFGTGTLRVGAPPKTIIDDGERHIVILTIWDADAETKVYWRSPDANDVRTTVIPGRGIQTFQTAGELKLEALSRNLARLKAWQKGKRRARRTLALSEGVRLFVPGCEDLHARRGEGADLRALRRTCPA